MKRFGALLLGLCLASAAGAATFTVTNTNDSGPGSLRQAITDANDNAGADTIAFAIPGADPGCDGSGVCTIAPTLPLPGLSDAVTIDGYTQTGASPNTNAEGAIDAVLKIVLSGANLTGSNGLYIQSTTSRCRASSSNGPWNFAVGSSSASDVVVRGCFLGVDASGDAASASPSGIGFSRPPRHRRHRRRPGSPPTGT